MPGFDIPDHDVSFHDHQSIWYSTDIDILTAGLNGVGVQADCAVTAQGSPDMTVAIASGFVRIAGGSVVAVTAGNGTISAADATNPRIDLVSVSDTGTKTVTAGTAATGPKPPDLPSGHVALAMVYVPANDTTIATNQITDKRVILQGAQAGAGWQSWSPIFKAGANTATWTGTAKYLDLGAMVVWYFNVTFTSTVASGLVTVTGIPTVMQGHDGSPNFGDGMWYDQGVNFYILSVYGGGAEWRFYRDAASGNQFTNAIGHSPADGASFWGVVTKSTRTFDVPTIGGAIAAQAYHSTTQGSLAVSTVNPLSLDTDGSDPYGFHDPSTNNTRMTVPAGYGGDYIAIGKAKVNQTFDIYVRKNGSTILRGGNKQSSGETQEVTVYAPGLIAGDYLEVCEFHGSGTGTAGDASNDHLRTELSIIRVDSGLNNGPVGAPAYAASVGWEPSAGVTNANLGTSGGTFATQIVVPARMNLRSLVYRATDTATARSMEWGLYRDDGVATATRVAYGTDSFTPGAASNRTSAVSDPSTLPVILQPGVYWLVMRNTGGATNFGTAVITSSTAMLGMIGIQTQTLGSALGTTLDMTTGWTRTSNNIFPVILRGNVFGETAAY